MRTLPEIDKDKQELDIKYQELRDEREQVHNATVLPDLKQRYEGKYFRSPGDIKHFRVSEKDEYVFVIELIGDGFKARVITFLVLTGYAKVNREEVPVHDLVELEAEEYAIAVGAFKDQVETFLKIATDGLPIHEYTYDIGGEQVQAQALNLEQANTLIIQEYKDYKPMKGEHFTINYLTSTDDRVTTPTGTLIETRVIETR